MILENKRVAFAQVTGDGDDDGAYKVALAVSKKDIKEIEKERMKVWDKSNTGTRKTPFQSVEALLTDDEDTGDKLFWIGCDADPANPSHKLDYIVGEEDDFGIKDFAIIGTDSKVTVEFNFFITKKNDKKKENVGRSLLAIQLLELVPFEGGSTPTTLKGKKLSEDGTSKKSKSEKSDKKDKNKKKKKSKD